MTISVRGSKIAFINNQASGVLTLPSGTTAGDYCVLFVSHVAPITNQPFGWNQLDDTTGSVISGAAFDHVLTASEVASGQVGVSFTASGQGIIALVVFVGSNAGHRTLISANNASGAASRTITTDSTPQSGDYAVFFSGASWSVASGATGTATSSGGSTLQSSSNPIAAGVLAGTLLGAAGAVSDTFNYSAVPTTTANGDYEIIVVVAPAPLSALSLRADLVTIDSTNEGYPALRGNLVTIDDLAEGFRNLRMSLFVIESLHPVAPEGTISTDLFPGSLGSPATLPGLAFAFHKRPRFATQVQQAASGVSVRNALMQYPIWEFELTFEFLRSDVNAEYQTLLGFFLQRQGGFDTFLFKDADDYQVTGGTLGTADGVTTQFDFKRTLGGFAEKVGQVDTGATINVYDNGVLKTAGTDYNVVLPNHVVFVTAPTSGHTITADFQFFFNCRFQADMADFDKFAQNFWELQSIVFETVPQ